jgi:Zn-dependent M28 family amino/carboxypeptidase
MLLLLATLLAQEPDTARVGHLLRTLAADSMEGRRTASVGERRAGEFLAREMRTIGLVPAGDHGSFFQAVPLVQLPGNNGRPGRMVLASDPRAPAEAPDSLRAVGRNVTGMLVGSDPALKDEAILLVAHYDHMGMGRPVGTDSIFNGADDDASGVTAIMEVARRIASGPRPKRTIIISAMTGEEMGLLGARHYLNQPAVPLEKTVAVLVVEMIARPDSLAGGPGKAWLTGYERSTMGDLLRDNGIPIIPDPRPSQNFFQRSDNYAFALKGIPAHTLSSYGLHTDYHRVTDEAALADLVHMDAIIAAATRAVRILADGARPAWHPGGQPTP